LQEFAGDLDDYQQWLRLRGKTPEGAAPTKTAAVKVGATQLAAAKVTATKSAANAAATKAASVNQDASQAPTDKKSSRRDPLARLRQQLEQVEGQIATLAAERALVEAELAGDPDDRLAARRANLQRDAAYLESRWMEIGTALEAEEAKSEK
jgi:hypothetical protein